MNRAYENAQLQAQQAAAANNSSSPEVQSPISVASGPPLSANPISPLSAPSSTSPAGSGVNPLNSAMVSNGGGADSSAASSVHSRAPTPDYKSRSESNLHLLNAPMSAPPTSHSNALGLHTLPSPMSAGATGGASYQPSERHSLSFPHHQNTPPHHPSQPTPSSHQSNQHHNNFFPLRPAFPQHSHSHSHSHSSHSYSSTSHPNSTHSTPHLSANQLSGGQNSPVSPAASLSGAPSPISQFAPARQPSISTGFQMSNHSGSHNNTLNSHSMHSHPHHSSSSFNTSSPPPRLPPITTQPHQNMSSYSSPVPRSQAGYGYNMYPSQHYGPPSSLGAMSMATMGWKDNLAVHGGNNSTISPIGHGYHPDSMDRRR
jgi:hypothetical protein